MPPRQLDFTAVVDLLTQKGTGLNSVQPSLDAEFRPPCNNACRAGEKSVPPHSIARRCVDCVWGGSEQEAIQVQLSLQPRLDPSEHHDDQAFAGMLAGLARQLAAYARRLTNGSVDADDLVQDTMLRCWTARRSFQPGTTFNAWAGVVMRNSFLSGRRRARFQAELPDDAIDQRLAVSENQEWAVQIRDMHWALSELTSKHRDAVLLAVEGLTMDEAADRLSISPSAFKSRLLRARVRLRCLTEDRNTPLLAAKPKPRQDRIERRHSRRDWTGVLIG